MKLRILHEINLKPRLSILLISLFFKVLGSAFSGVALATENPALGITSMVVCFFWFVLLFLVTMPSTDVLFSKYLRWLDRVAKIAMGVLVIAGILEIVFVLSIHLGVFEGNGKGQSNLITTFERLGVYSDSTALDQQAANNFLKGGNPYVEANIIKAGIEFGVPATKLTPLRTGQFANDFPYPSLDKMEKIYVDVQATPDKIPPEFESKYNYPAASFILLAPFIALGITDLRIIFLIFLLPVFGYVIWQIKSNNKMKFLFIAATIASLEIWNSLSSGSTSILVFPLLLMAWLLYRKNLWLSALFMGVALATKQIAWFLFPFYLILILREKGLKKAAFITAITGGIFLCFNLPYILANPGLWISSVMAPMTNNIFPSNILIIALNYIGLIDIKTPLPFTIIEVIVIIVALIWYYRNCRRLPETALVLAIFPFFFSWRGSWGLFILFQYHYIGYIIDIWI